jgi:hypothetical protein
MESYHKELILPISISRDQGFCSFQEHINLFESISRVVNKFIIQSAIQEILEIK